MSYLVTEYSFVFPVQLKEVCGVSSIDDGLKLALKRTLPAHVVEQTAVKLQVDEVVLREN